MELDFKVARSEFVPLDKRVPRELRSSNNRPRNSHLHQPYRSKIGIIQQSRWRRRDYVAKNLRTKKGRTTVGSLVRARRYAGVALFAEAICKVRSLANPEERRMGHAGVSWSVILAVASVTILSVLPGARVVSISFRATLTHMRVHVPRLREINVV